MQVWVLCSTNVHLIEFVYCVVQIYSLFFSVSVSFYLFFSVSNLYSYWSFICLFYQLPREVYEYFAVWVWTWLLLHVVLSIFISCILRLCYEVHINLKLLYLSYELSISSYELNLLISRKLLAFNFLFLQITEWQILAR